MPAICVVAPYPELADVARQVSGDLGLADVEVAVGDLHHGLEQARALVAQGCEVLVSRGGTALLLRRHLAAPVVEVEVSAFDLLRSLSELPRGFSGQIRIIGFGNIISGAEHLGRAMGFRVQCTTLAEGMSFPTVIAEVARAGVDVIVGDAVTVRLAQDAGVRGLLITSGREAMQSALQEALRILHVLRQERHRAAQLKAILDSSHDAIVAADQEHRITVFNRQAEELFGLPAGPVLGQPAAQALAGTGVAGLLTGEDVVRGRLRNIGDVTVLVNRTPVEVGDTLAGAVATFRDVSELQKAEHRVRRELYAKGLAARHRLEDIRTVSEPVLQVVRMARRYAASDSTLLIQGESGTGKEMFAQGVHNAGPRRDGPFVAVNCAAIPDSLLESQLFGYAEGAFTGATRGGRPGFFELAHRGTIFLDEVGEMPLTVQSRLLRVIQEREVMRVGGDRVLPISVRVIAATNRDLAAEVAAGRFRLDLYYRLKVLELAVPPLRERKADVPLLLEHFLEKLAASRGEPPVRLHPDLLAMLGDWDWPGNVRELISVAERLDLLAAGGGLDGVQPDQVLPSLGLRAQPAAAGAPAGTDGPAAAALTGTLDEIVDQAVAAALAAEGGNLSRAARRLGVDRTTLWRRLRRQGRADRP